MRFRAFIGALVGSCIVPLSLLAHGPQLQINQVGGEVVTRNIMNDVYEPLTDPKSVYVIPVLEYRGVWYARPETSLYQPPHLLAGDPIYYSGAGLAFGLGQTFEVGSVFKIEFEDGLKLWAGTSFGDAGDVQLQAYRGGSIGLAGELINPSASAISSDSGPFAELPFAPVAAGYDNEAHSTARLRFLGDGTTSVQGTGTTATEPGDGIYLARFQVTNTYHDTDTMTDVTIESDPFYFVLHKNAAWGDVRDAARSLGAPSDIQYLGVPEPHGLASPVVLFSALGWSIRRRRKE
jgi:hypothetical protein